MRDVEVPPLYVSRVSCFDAGESPGVCGRVLVGFR